VWVFAGHASGMFPVTVCWRFGVLLYSGGFFNGTGREAFYSKNFFLGKKVK
jgi:hypothetical protein